MTVVSIQSSESRKIKSFKDLIAWQKSMSLVESVYKLTNNFPKEEVYVLTSQVRRAAISVSSNIAEGSSKKSSKEFIRFLMISYGSLSEIECQLIIANRLNYIKDSELNEIINLIKELGKIINGLVNSINKKLNSEL